MIPSLQAGGMERVMSELLWYFSEKEELPFYEAGTELVTDFHCLAFITVDEAQMITFRDALIPQRAVLAK